MMVVKIFLLLLFFFYAKGDMFGIFPPASDLVLLCIKGSARGKDRCVCSSGGLLGKLAHLCVL